MRMRRLKPLQLTRGKLPGLFLMEEGEEQEELARVAAAISTGLLSIEDEDE